LIGTALSRLLESQGHELIKLSLHKKDGNSLYWNPYESIMPIDDFLEIDVVIHLAAESITQLWTKKAKERIYESRVTGTKFLAEAIFNAKNRPKLFISASGASIYESSENKAIAADEQSTLSEGGGFLSQVAKAWEQSTKIIEETETRLILLRTGIVLSKEGGALASMLPIFRAGLGGPQGSGKQLVSWIDIADLVNAIYFCIFNQGLKGPVNMVAPEVVTNAEFSQTIANTLHRPCWFRVPGFLLKLVLGELAEETILQSTNIYPKKLIDSGFKFKYETLEKSLRHLLKGD